MKRIISFLERIFAVALVLILAIGSVDTIAFAATKENAPSVIYFEEHCTNPLYYNNYCDTAAQTFEISGHENAEQRYSSNDDAEEVVRCATIMRDNMMARNKRVSLEINSYNADHATLVRNIIQMAISKEFANSPAAGDYLAWHYGGYNYSGYARLIDGKYNYHFDFDIPYYSTAEEEVKVTNAVNKALEEMHIDQLNQYEAIKSIYDFICKTCDYDYSTPNNNTRFSAYGAIIKGKAVCQGYSTLLYRMLEEAGIDSKIITSTEHSWNIVRIGAEYYNLDVTWDDNYYNLGRDYVYFLKCNSHFKNHPREAQYTTAEFNNKYFMSDTCYLGSEIARTRCTTVCTDHQYVVVANVPATCTAAGYKIEKCEVCGEEKSTELKCLGHKLVIDKAVSPTYATSGKTQGAHCSVCKKIITPQKEIAKLTVAGTNITKETAKKKGFEIKWGKQAGATGYEIQYSTTNKFATKNTKTKKINKNSTTANTVTKLKGNTKYYTRIRAYKVYNGKTYYSSWSNVKNVKTKK